MNKLTSLFNKFTGSSPAEKKIDGDKEMESRFLVDEKDPIELKFVKQFSGAEGKFFFCESTTEFKEVMDQLFELNNWEYPFCTDSSIAHSLESHLTAITKSVDQSDCFITSCEFLIADEGGIMITEKHMEGKRLSELPQVLIIVANISQIVNKIGDGLRGIKTKYLNNFPSKITTLKGPNRVHKKRDSKIGSHEPKDIYLILLDE